MNSSHSGRRSSSTYRRVLRLAGKELSEILRDRRTIITLVVMPLLVYPLLGIVIRNALLSGSLPETPEELKIGVPTESEAELLGRYLGEADLLLAEQADADPPSEPDRDPSDRSPFGELPRNGGSPAIAGIPPEVLPIRETPAPVTLRLVVLDQEQFPTDDPHDALRQLVEGGVLDLAVTAEQVPSAEVSGRHPGTLPFSRLTLLKRESSSAGDLAEHEVTRRLELVNRAWNQILLRSAGLTERAPTVFETVEIGSSAGGVATLVTFVPLVLVLMTMTGAVYPAIDLTAGERERGTMEILIAAPVSRMTLLSGKFFAVLTVAVLTAVMNLLSMFVTLFALGLEGVVLKGTTWSTFAAVLLLMIVFAAFFSAVLLSITSVARSFREAQAYLIPLMLISLTPGVFSLMPNLNMTPLLAVTPLVSTVLMARDVLQGHIQPGLFVIVILSTFFYGLLALSIASRIFGADSVLQGGRGSWSDLLRRPGVGTDRASVGTAFSVLALIFALFVVIGTLPSRLAESWTARIALGGVLAFPLFVGVPLAASWFAGIRRKSGFSLFSARPAAWAAAVLLGVSLWPFIFEIEILLLGDDGITAVLERSHGLEEALAAVPLGVRLAALAFAPALCEELFFRGFLQNSLRTRLAAWQSVVLAAALFGVFHVLVQGGLRPERFIPSTLTGLVLGVLFERSRSVWPGVLLHVTHNSVLNLVAEFDDRLALTELGTESAKHLPLMWLAAAGVTLIIGAAVLSRVRPVASATASTDAELLISAPEPRV